MRSTGMPHPSTMYFSSASRCPPRVATLLTASALLLLLLLLPPSLPTRWQELWGAVASHHRTFTVPTTGLRPAQMRAVSVAPGWKHGKSAMTMRLRSMPDTEAEAPALVAEEASAEHLRADSVKLLSHEPVLTIPVPGGQPPQVRHISSNTSKQMFHSMLLIGLEGRSASSVCFQAEAILRDSNFAVTSESEGPLREFFHSAANRVNEFTGAEVARLFFNVAQAARRDPAFASAITQWSPSIVDALAKRLVEESDRLAVTGPEAAKLMWALDSLNMHKGDLMELLFNRLLPEAQLVQGQDMVRAVRGVANVDPQLMERMTDFLIRDEVCDRLGVQAITSILCTYATAGIHPPKLFEKLGNRLVQPEVAVRFTPVVFARVLWAFAKAGIEDQLLMKALLMRANTENFWLGSDGHVLSMTLWSMATLHLKELAALRVITNSITSPKVVNTLSPQQIGIVLWAFTQLGTPNNALPILTRRFKDRSFLAACGPQCLSGVAWATAQLRFEDAELMNALAARAQAGDMLSAFSGTQLANFAWAFATINLQNAPLFQAIAHAALQPTILNSLTAPVFASLAWAFGTLEVSNTELLWGLATRVLDPSFVSQLTSPQAANVLWAFAMLRMENLDAVEALVVRIRESKELGVFSSEDMVNIAWATAVLRVPDNSLIYALAKHLVSSKGLVILSSHDLTLLCWAFGMKRAKDEPLMEKAAEIISMKGYLDTMSPRDVVAISWAFARLDVRKVPLLQSIARRVLFIDFLPSLSERELSDLLWAFAALRFRDNDLLNAIAARFLSGDLLRQSPPQHLSFSMWSFSRLAFRHHEFFNAACERLLEEGFLTSNPNAKVLSNIAWALAVHGIFHKRLMVLLIKTVLIKDVWSQMSTTALSNLLWACAKLLLWNEELMVQVREDLLTGPFLTQCSSTDLANLLWALGTLRAEDEEVLATIAIHLLRTNAVTSFTAKECLNVAWGFVRLRMYDRRLLETISLHVVGKGFVEELNAQEMSSLAWAYAKSGVPSPDLMQALVRRFAADSHLFQSLTTVEWVNAIWAFSEQEVDVSILPKFMPMKMTEARLIERLPAVSINYCLLALARYGYHMPHIVNTLVGRILDGDVLPRIGVASSRELYWSLLTLKVTDQAVLRLVEEAAQPLGGK
eukprot:GGOE01014695.1.p1 GENE.GGOE01014695.1~~GGOE01014695.1.p1  ORF type:complete len:1149 (-),score=312.54 GGOE01014695.1:255-3701(-)